MFVATTAVLAMIADGVIAALADRMTDELPISCAATRLNRRSDTP